jgi:hypothetical protein
VPRGSNAPKHVVELARRRRVHAPIGQLARAHLDVEGELFVDLLIEGNAPEPRPK